ncbi:uncharacterized protein LOC120843168 [Ixodes scapularis]|uniref:uncharacterized protein LOC120843168 n=1 Tax=Ixodes scapularis TaxID=6945 RepID=UPI001C388539|nr:uncharacterized protein LOC120843168 [Ixodes scapularis]
MLFMAVLAFFGLAPAAALHVDTGDGGYTGIVVAIHESVQHHPYIVENIKVVANSGASGKKFTASTKSGGKCTLYKHCQLSEDCIVRFYEEDFIGSSVMFMPRDGNASELTRGLKYNYSSPVHTQHYSVCRGKSTSEVINSNEDFKLLHDPNMEKAIEITFREVQRSEGLNGRIVLVFDVSEEMEVDNRITTIKNAAAFFIRSVVPDGHRLAIVAFAENATIISELAVVDNSTRRSLVTAIRTLSATGPWGRVSDGLRKAIEVLDSGNRAETGGMIVLASRVTEGQSYDDISGLVPWLEDNHVAVNTVVFGSGDSTMPSLLRERTRGMSHLVTDFAQESELEVQSGVEASLVEFLAARMDLQEQPIIVLNARKDFEDIIEVNFTLPSGTGKDTRVHILGTSLRSVIASLVNPDNDVCVRCVEARDDDSSIDLHVPSAAMEGVWKLVLSKSTTHTGNSSNIGVLVTTYQMQSDVEPVRLKLYTAPLDESTAQTIFVDVWKGLQAVLAAEVIATIIGLNASHHAELKLQLRDDGLGMSHKCSKFSTRGPVAIP